MGENKISWFSRHFWVLIIRYLNEIAYAVVVCPNPLISEKTYF